MTISLKILAIGMTPLLLLGGLTACSPLTLINAATPGYASEKSRDIHYGSDQRNQLDIYRPRDAKAAAPVVVFFYGGSWNMGSRSDYAFVGEALAARGIVAVLADYRLYPQVRYPAFVDDSAQAVAWTLKEIQRYGGDPKRVFVMGHSAGAYNAAMVALDTRWLAAQGASPTALRGWIGLAGPYDFIPIDNRDVRPVFFYPDTPTESQPINHVTSGAPPALLIASHADKVVNAVRNTTGLSTSLRAAGVPVEEIYFDNTSHVSLIGAFAWPLRGLAPVLDTVVGFVDSDGGRNKKMAR
ncbi:alpha/beta hydrolase [Actimicrobium antarcticum]|uniref:Alpha/beta hydrolase n=1 Tax=Actimicrobium antarcticum TaxID=1051899 RepID=A0ABP7TWK5_9BURK